MYKCEQYFNFDDTKVRVASLHLDAKALQWHQNYKRYMRSLDYYVQSLSVRNGEELHYDSFAELMNLK